MSNSLQDVMSAAVEAAARKMAGETSPRRESRLRAVESGRPAAPPADAESLSAASVAADLSAASIAAPGTDMACADMAFSGDNGLLGRGGLRLAFWICGLNEALRERQRKGERLTEREDSLMTLARKDFAGLRPRVIAMALERLDAVVNAPDPSAGVDSSCRPGTGVDAYRPGTMEAFALEALRNLSSRAGQLLREDGPDAALSLFGNGAGVREPLAIFQLVFTTAAGLVEAFDRFVPADARLLAHLGAALGSEVERI